MENPMVIASFIISLLALIVGSLALFLNLKEFRAKIPAITKASWNYNPDGKKIFSITVVSPDIVPIKNLLIQDSENDNAISCDYVINNDSKQSYLIKGGNEIEITASAESLSNELQFILNTPYGKSQEYFNEITSGSFSITPSPATAKAETMTGQVVIHDYLNVSESIKVEVVNGDDKPNSTK